MSKDPEDGTVAIPSPLHRYLYASGDPATMVDPTGRGWLEYKLIAKEVGALSAEAFLAAGRVVCAEFAAAAWLLYEATGKSIPEEYPAPCEGWAAGEAAAAAIIFAIDRL